MIIVYTCSWRLIFYHLWLIIYIVRNIVTYSSTNRLRRRFSDETFEFHKNGSFRTGRKKFSKVLIFHCRMRCHQMCRLSQCSCTRIPRTHLRVPYQIENREKDRRNLRKILFARKFHSTESSYLISFLCTCCCV